MSAGAKMDWEPLRQFWILLEDEGEGVEELIGTFLTDAPLQLRALDSALEQARRADLGRVAHTLKGSSSQLGAFELARCCQGLEQSARGLGPELAEDEAVAAIHREFEAVAALLKSWREHLPRPF